MTHSLKTWPEPFAAVLRGDKTAEFRKNDRGFAAGDELVLMEWAPNPSLRAGGEYTGRAIAPLRVTDVRAGGQFGIPDGYAMLSFKRLL